VWQRVFARFFLWVWLCIVALFASGLTMVSLEFGGFSTLSPYVRIMMTLAVVMTLIFLYIYLLPWRRFRAALAGENWPAADTQIKRIRLLVGSNLLLGLITVIVGASGRLY
jgi:uncharacterized membrane protein